MKITKKKLEDIIREEIQNLLNEAPGDKYFAMAKAYMKGQDPLRAGAAKELEDMRNNPFYGSKSEKSPNKKQGVAKTIQGAKKALTALEKIKKIAQGGKPSDRQSQRAMENISVERFGPLNIAQVLRQDLIQSGNIPKIRIKGYSNPRVDQKHPLYTANVTLEKTLMNVFKNAEGTLEMSAEILQGDISQIEAAEQALKSFQTEVLKYK